MAPAGRNETATTNSEMSTDGSVIQVGPYQQYIPRRRAHETDGDVVEMEAIVQPNRMRPGLHVHPHQRERFTVESGRIGIGLGDDERLLEAGEEVTIPPGTPHTFWTASDRELRFVAELQPALQFERFIRTVAKLDEQRRLAASGLPRNPLIAAMLAHQFRDTVQLASPSPAVQRAVFAPLATVGRALGYRLPTGGNDA